MIRGFKLDLAHYKSIGEFEPQVGDFIIHHGWLTHWFGVIGQTNPDGTIEVIRAGLPLLLFTLSSSKQDKSKLIIDLDDIKTSKGGKYAAIKCMQNLVIWYV